MTVTPETARWEALAAARTRGDVGEGIASVLAFLGQARGDLVRRRLPRSGDVPARARRALQEFAGAGELSAFQYAPTRLPGRWTRSPTG